RRQVEEQIDHLTERRKRLTVLYADEQIGAADYQAAIAETAQGLEALRAEQAGIAQQPVSEHDLAAVASWLGSLPSWTSLLDRATMEQRNQVYRRCIAACILDAPAGVLVVRWTPALARLAGAETSRAKV